MLTLWSWRLSNVTPWSMNTLSNISWSTLNNDKKRFTKKARIWWEFFPTMPCLHPHNKTQQDNKANYWSAQIWVLARLSKKEMPYQRAKNRFLKDDDSPILLQVVGSSHELKKLLKINCRNHLFSLSCFLSIEKACLQVMIGCIEGHSGMQKHLRGFLQTPSDERSYNISDRKWQAYNSTFDERIVHDNDFNWGLEISHLERELLSQHIW